MLKTIATAIPILTIILGIIIYLYKWAALSAIDKKLLPLSETIKMNVSAALFFPVAIFISFFSFLQATLFPKSLNFHSTDFIYNITFTIGAMLVLVVICEIVFFCLSYNKKQRVVLSNGWFLLNSIDSEHFTVALDEKNKSEKIITIQELSKYTLTVKTIKLK